MIQADKFTPVDAGLIPTGELRDVAGTPFDFANRWPSAARIDQDEEQLNLAAATTTTLSCGVRMTPGNPWPRASSSPPPAASWKFGPPSPACSFYTGNFLDGKTAGKGGITYPPPQRILPGNAALS